MSSLRIIYDNYADVATITATSTAAGSLLSDVKNEYKAKAHRSVGTSQTYTLTWGSSKNIGGIGLPATNLSPTATIRVKLWNNTTELVDSGIIYACPGNTLELWNWSMPLNSNAFIYGGASKSAVWFSNQTSCNKVTIELVDTSNPVGYIDCSRIVAGPFWEPKYGASNGIEVTLNDASSITRADSGDLVADRGFLHDRLSFDFSLLEESDKLSLMQIMRKIGVSKNVFVSVYPDNNSTMEQMYSIYGKRDNSSVITEFYGIYKNSMNLEGW
jgi:hypothetical protein